MNRLMFVLVILAFVVIANAATFVVAEKGDCLSKIAQEQGLTLGRVLEMNPNFKSNPDLLLVGDTVIVAREETIGFVADGFFSIVIEPGDQLGLIAKRFDVEIDALATLNGIENPDLIIAGDTLRISAVDVAEAEPKEVEFIDPFTAILMEAKEFALGPNPNVESGKEKFSGSACAAAFAKIRDAVRIAMSARIKNIVSVAVAKTVSPKPITKEDFEIALVKAGISLDPIKVSLDTGVSSSIADVTLNSADTDVIKIDTVATQSVSCKSQFMAFLWEEMQSVFVIGTILCLFAAVVIRKRKQS